MWREGVEGKYSPLRMCDFSPECGCSLNLISKVGKPEFSCTPAHKSWTIAYKMFIAFIVWFTDNWTVAFLFFWRIILTVWSLVQLPRAFIYLRQKPRSLLKVVKNIVAVEGFSRRQSVFKSLGYKSFSWTHQL